MTLPVFSDAGYVLCLVCIFLVPLAAAGLALITVGLGRSRNAAHAILSSICAFTAAVAAFFVVGRALMGDASSAARVITFGGVHWNWIAAEPFWMRGVRFDLSTASLVLLFQTFCAGLAALIPVGAGTERWRLGNSAASSALLAAFVFPLFGHWAWSGGWLATLGTTFGLGDGFIDLGGSGVVQCLGGLAGLSALWALGPRRGKYSHGGQPVAIPGHNMVLVLLGGLVALPGWIGLNSAGAMLFGTLRPQQVTLVALNTLLCAVFAALAAAFSTRLRFGKPDASLCVNGWLGGLVASSAACALLPPFAAAVVGVIAGTLVTFVVDLFELKLSIDDPGGFLSVHAVCGISGLLAVPLLGRIDGATPGAGQWLAQIIGIASLLGFVLPVCYILQWILGRVMPMRVVAEAERHGLDLHELGAGAYPEFVTHTDEYNLR